MTARPNLSASQALPHQPEVSPRRISRRDKDLGLPSPIPEEPTSSAAAATSNGDAIATPVACNSVDQISPTPADGLSERPSEPEYRGSSDDSDADMVDEDEQNVSGSDESEISLQGTPKVYTLTLDKAAH